MSKPKVVEWWQLMVIVDVSVALSFSILILLIRRGDKLRFTVLFNSCDKDTCVQRCLSRGAAGSGRSDDNVESLEKRFVTYQSATMPIIEHYRKQGLVVEVDAGRSPEEVFEEVRKNFEK